MGLTSPEDLASSEERQLNQHRREDEGEAREDGVSAGDGERKTQEPIRDDDDGEQVNNARHENPRRQDVTLPRSRVLFSSCRQHVEYSSEISGVGRTDR